MRTDDVLCITDEAVDKSGKVLLDSHRRDGQFNQSTDQLGYPLVGSKVKLFCVLKVRVFRQKSLSRPLSMT